MFSLGNIKIEIKECLEELYQTDSFLFRRNSGRGVCERCLVFRFAHYLQNRLDSHYVDCDFNSSFTTDLGAEGDIIRRERSGKSIRNVDGSETKRFVDIIIHKRDYDTSNDFICFELKKWDNNSVRKRNKDYNILKKLTLDYGYFYGFHIVFGRTRNDTKWTIFRRGKIITKNALIFETN